MKSRTRFIDIAKQAGVGIATVDRVLNERGGVSERTTKIVLDAARELQINRLLPQSNRRRLYVEAIFCRNQSTHYSRLNDALQTVSDIVDFPISVYRTHFDVTETEKLVEHIDSTFEARDGFILFAYNTPYLAQNIRRLTKKTTIVTISTDIPEVTGIAMLASTTMVPDWRQQKSAPQSVAKAARFSYSNPQKKPRRNPAGFWHSPNILRHWENPQT